jgi:hypothetical protein
LEGVGRRGLSVLDVAVGRHIISGVGISIGVEDVDIRFL